MDKFSLFVILVCSLGALVGAVALIAKVVRSYVKKKQDKDTVMQPKFLRVPIVHRNGSPQGIILGLMNKERKRVNPMCHLLKADGGLQEIARETNLKMIQKKDILLKGMSEEEMEYGVLADFTIGENTAYGYRDSESVMGAWTKSENHYHNYMDPIYKYCGISVLRDIDNINWYCVVFR